MIYESPGPLHEDVADFRGRSVLYGVCGLFHDNTVISLGKAAGTNLEPNIEERTPNKDHGGFLDECFTPQSTASGKVRVSEPGLSIRIMTKHTIDIASEMLAGLRFGSAIGLRNWVVRCMGFCCVATEKDVRSIVNKWKTYCEVNRPTVHVFKDEKVLTVSVATGILIRPMRMTINSSRIVNEGPSVDSVSMHNSDTMRFASLSFSKREDEPVT
ncbi:hypothetical protein TI39_contig4142g00007 [Zymoseptoria brevis]|uniref:Uncharacterized protein n=1 Tax=Zymoseptoria brevis TaxID=1047168 RepID=A0A0F4GCB5_9PEZI|nr:hypothetical protein TI39_contig4142g00007 [Zymoseptoria brevis]